MVSFHKTLSEGSVYMRYFHVLPLDRRVAHERLTRICFVDYDREIALVADRRNSDVGEHEIIGVGRLTKLPNTNEAEFAILVSDKFQGRGLGTELLRRILEVGRAEKLRRIKGEILPENPQMQAICRKLGFQLRHAGGDTVVQASFDM
jgi:acetyltransferase